MEKITAITKRTFGGISWRKKKEKKRQIITISYLATIRWFWKKQKNNTNSYNLVEHTIDHMLSYVFIILVQIYSVIWPSIWISFKDIVMFNAKHVFPFLLLLFSLFCLFLHVHASDASGISYHFSNLSAQTILYLLPKCIILFIHKNLWDF